MGSPEFALPSLEIILSNKDFVVDSIYTKPPRASGRGLSVSKTPVHSAGELLGIKVFTPSTLKDQYVPEVDVIVLVAYGLIIPKHILESPKYGCINLHPSLLPRWRGASPIESAILSGDEFTGVSIIKMNEYLDEGDVFSMKKILIKNSNFFELYNKLAVLGADMLIEVLEKIEFIEPKTQSNFGVTYAPKIKPSLIDWSNFASYIEREIRAFGGKSFYFNKKLIKILKASFVDVEHSFNVGDIVNDELHIACYKSILIPLIVQPDGKKPMSIEDFLNGLR